MKGYSLHLGVNETDPIGYPGLMHLKGAVNDADWWDQYAQKLGYHTQHLHDRDATTIAVKEIMTDYASKMNAGDIFLLTYSGHGGQIPNEKMESIDKEKMDQTWCLYDRQFLDDEIYDCFRAFKNGTRIVVVADSCHSGTITRDPGFDLSQFLLDGMTYAKAAKGELSRQVPEKLQTSINRNMYEKVYGPIIKKYKKKNKRKGVNASVKLLAACQDYQVTYDGQHNGIFTEALSKILTRGWTGNAEKLIAEIRSVYAYPKPNFFQYGSIIPEFDKSLPFNIDITNAKVEGYRDPEIPESQEFQSPDDFYTGDINRNAILVADITGTPGNAITGGAEINILKTTKADGHLTMLLEMRNIPYRHGWSAAHALTQSFKQLNIEAKIEPVLSYNPGKPGGISRAADDSNPDYIREWPPASDTPAVKIGWHLDDHHSQLATAAARVAAKEGAYVKIGHLDTGYVKNHIGLPKNLDSIMARSFVAGEENNAAIDPSGSGNDGHGLGTLCLLAGNKVTTNETFGEYAGYIGGAYMADVLPLRIADSVVILNSRNFCEALDYAVEQNCEVVTMSMAGKPDKAMAKAVNRAYEAGLVIVSAASNCWYKGLKSVAPKCVLFPAAFDRVIAATGALYNHMPYDKGFLLDAGEKSLTQYMQGCWGPASRMNKALAAYTPNTPWASTKYSFVKNGGGTSSATPQVAAAAALYIAYHREELEAKGYYEEGKKWMKVEAVRHALYHSASKSFVDYKKYFGNGIIRANDALNIPVADSSLLTISKDAHSSFGGILEMAGSLFLNRPLFRDGLSDHPEVEALSMELLHLLQTDPVFSEDFSNLDLTDKTKVDELFNSDIFVQRVLDSSFASEYLKQAIAG